MNFSTQQKEQLIQQGFKLLYDNFAYSQSDVVQKLIYLDHPTTRPVINRILNNTRVGEKTLQKIFIGFQILVKKELGMRIGEKAIWEKVEGLKRTIIPIEKINSKKEGLIFHAEGRLEIHNKVQFYNSAIKEIYEIGLTLNTFSSYFLNRNPTEFKDPITQLLERGIDLKCYLLDPEWNGTKLYFTDRTKGVKESLSGEKKIRTSLRKLKVICEEFEAKNLEGKLEVFTYRHLPHNYFLAIDPQDAKGAKMMISNYLYGLRRAECPVFEFSRKEQPILFHRYYASLSKLIKGAKKVDFEKITS